jgi:hypothetical protein
VPLWKRALGRSSQALMTKGLCSPIAMPVVLELLRTNLTQRRTGAELHILFNAMKSHT